MPSKVKMTESELVVGQFLVLWRNEMKQPAKIIDVDKAAQRIKYELVGGPDKGKKYSSRFDSGQTVNVYDEQNVMLALLETGGSN